ncbi:TetR/AcrR family transcriptional regulator [Promicromonospora sukumoe]|uniref:TetR/AcrR family transcriptional regulator n=1 Tax=Promicromonospora sukumoe TaxID=88382 RepID=UPI000A061E5D
MSHVSDPETPAGGPPDDGATLPAADDVPAGLARLWRLGAPSRLGRRAVLDVDQVVGAAIGLADRGGLAGVTLPKVAQELGVTPMSLYRYVGSKDELLVLMADQASGPAEAAPGTEGADAAADVGDDPAWRTALRCWAADVRGMYLRHPWLVHLPVQGPPSGPHGLARMDAGLAALRGTDLDWAAKVGVVTLVSGYVRTASQLAADLSAARAGSGLDQAQSEQEYGRAMARLVRPDRFPEVAALFGSGLFEQEQPEQIAEEGPDHDFRFGLETVLDGVAVAVERAAGAVRPSRARPGAARPGRS